MMKWISLSLSIAVMACAASPSSSPGTIGGSGGSKGSGGSTGTGGGNSSGGSVGTGGNGSGGSASGGATLGADCINNPDDLIADFKTDNGLYSSPDGRQGGFYTYGDDSEKTDPPMAVLNPPEGGAGTIDSSIGNDECSGPGSFHVTATGFAIWGAALGTNFGPMDGTYKGWYDASKYKGVSFWAKAAKPLTGVQISFPDVYTDGNANPVDVDPSATMCSYGSSLYNCSPFLVKLGDATYPNYMDYQIDTNWKRFDILFQDTLQDPNNVPGRLLPVIGHLDLAHLTSMAIQVNAIHNSDNSISANDFEIWVDDFYFIR